MEEDVAADVDTSAAPAGMHDQGRTSWCLVPTAMPDAVETLVAARPNKAALRVATASVASEHAPCPAEALVVDTVAPRCAVVAGDGATGWVCEVALLPTVCVRFASKRNERPATTP